MSWSKAPVGLSQLFSTMTVNKQSTCYQLAQWLWLWERESRMGGTFCFREGHSSHICFRFTPCLPLLVCVCVWMFLFENKCVCGLCVLDHLGRPESMVAERCRWQGSAWWDRFTMEKVRFLIHNKIWGVCLRVCEKAEVCSKIIL